MCRSAPPLYLFWASSSLRQLSSSYLAAPKVNTLATSTVAFGGRRYILGFSLSNFLPGASHFGSSPLAATLIKPFKSLISMYEVLNHRKELINFICTLSCNIHMLFLSTWCSAYIYKVNPRSYSS